MIYRSLPWACSTLPSFTAWASAMQSDSNQLIAYVMQHHKDVKSQAQAMSWLDKHIPTWKTTPAPEPVSTIFYAGESDGYENEQ